MRLGLTKSWGSALLAGLLVLAMVAIVAGASIFVSWRLGPSSPFAFTRFDGETVSEADIPGFGTTRTFFLGGRQADDSTSGEVWSFDGTTYTDTGTAMSVPVSNYEIAKLTNGSGTVLLYIFGGRTGAGTVVRTVQTYNPMTNTAATLPAADDYPGKTPSGCIALPAQGMAVVGNKAYVMGGIASTTWCAQAELTRQTWIFDPTAPSGSRWTKGPNLKTARGYITPAVVGTVVYAIGGDIWSEDGTLLIAVANVEAFKTQATTLKWRNKASLPQPCDESQAFGFKSGDLAKKVVLAGCGQWPAALANSYIYDTLTDTWTETDALNEARRNQAGALSPLSKKTMYVVGGYGADGVTVIQTSETSKAQLATRATSKGSSRPLLPVRPGRYATY